MLGELLEFLTCPFKDPGDFCMVRLQPAAEPISHWEFSVALLHYLTESEPHTLVAGCSHLPYFTVMGADMEGPGELELGPNWF